MTLEENRKHCILKAIERTQSAKEAAALCGITERTMHNYLRNWDMYYDKMHKKYLVHQPKCLVI